MEKTQLERDIETEEFKEKIIELFNKYDVLLVHIDGKILPVKNTSKQECYNLLYDIQELIDWRKLLWRKYHPGYCALVNNEVKNNDDSRSSK